MESIRMKKIYTSKEHEFEISCSLSEHGQSITYIVNYKGISGGNQGFQINSTYVNGKKFTEDYQEVKERCNSIAERLSGWKEVTRTLGQLGFEMEVED